jgi:hypothetical protein
MRERHKLHREGTKSLEAESSIGIQLDKRKPAEDDMDGRGKKTTRRMPNRTRARRREK